MGQRLVVDIIENDEVVAAIYYHWSAYFTSTVYRLAELSRAILNAEKEGKNKLLAIIEKIEEDQVKIGFLTGESEIIHGGIRRNDTKDLEAAQKLFPDHKFKIENISRNEGLIALTEETIKDLHSWEEGGASINLDTHKIYNYVDLDPDPFEFVDAEYYEEDGEQYFDRANSGIIKINDKTCDVDAFDCTCEEIIKLEEFMDKEYEIWSTGLRKTSEGALTTSDVQTTNG